MIVQERDLHLLRELSVMRVADREQVKIVAGFGSTTRANARLLLLFHAGLLRRFFLGSGGGRKALYGLSLKGAQLAGVPCRGPRRANDAMLIADFFVQHQLAINELYCALKYTPIPVPGVVLRRWLAIHQPIKAGLDLIPDGYVEFFVNSEIVRCYLEVDLGHESLSIWKKKIDNYVTLAELMEDEKKSDRDSFRVLVVVNSERRMHSIRKTVEAVTKKIFWFATLESVRNDFFKPVWLRPVETQPRTIF